MNLTKTKIAGLNLFEWRKKKQQTKKVHTQVTDITSCYAYEAIQGKYE